MECLTGQEFECISTGRCINTSLVLDGKNNCPDGSDEQCQSPIEYKCHNSTVCIHRAQVKDGLVDCPSGDDETTTLKCFNSSEKVCKSGRCIPLNNQEYVCAENTVCADDEFSCKDTNTKQKAECILRSKVMNGVVDCSNGADEKRLLRCYNEKEFRCRDSGRCIPVNMVNDNQTDCADASDEVFCDVDNKFKCYNSEVIICIPRRLVNDGTSNCEKGEDENVGNFKCHNGTEVACEGFPPRCHPSDTDDKSCLGENSSSTYKKSVSNFFVNRISFLISIYILF